MNNKTDFKLSKELNKYIEIDTYWNIDKQERLYRKGIQPSIVSLETYPAPTLEELLGVCPIHIAISVEVFHKKYLITSIQDDKDEIEIREDLTCNLAQKVAEIMLQYFEEQERRFY